MTNQNDWMARIEKLETQNRRLKRGGLLLGGLLGAAFMTSMVAPRMCDTIYAERFVLHNAKNKEVLRLDAYSQSDPQITMRDNQGKERAKIGMEKGSVYVEMVGNNGKRSRVKFDDAVAPKVEEKPACDKQPDTVGE